METFIQNTAISNSDEKLSQVQEIIGSILKLADLTPDDLPDAPVPTNLANNLLEIIESAKSSTELLRMVYSKNVAIKLETVRGALTSTYSRLFDAVALIDRFPTPNLLKIREEIIPESEYIQGLLPNLEENLPLELDDENEELLCSILKDVDTQLQRLLDLVGIEKTIYELQESIHELEKSKIGYESKKNDDDS